MHAPARDPSVAILSDPSTLEQYDGFLFGIPTRYGTFPAQWRQFWDKTGKQWMKGSYWGKFAGVFISTGTQGGGQESTALAAISTLTHHGMIFVPLGYKTAAALLNDNSEVRGGSPWGAGTFAVSPRMPPSCHFADYADRFTRAVMARGHRPPKSSNLRTLKVKRFMSSWCDEQEA